MASWKYLPILKWKRGEKDALRYLTANQWDEVVPLIEIQPDKTLDLPGLRADLAVTVEKSIPVGGTVCIDTGYLFESGTKPLEVVMSFRLALRKALPDRDVLPVLNGPTVSALPTSSAKAKEVLASFPEVVLRLRSDLILPTQIKPAAAAIRKAGVKASGIHIVIDQFSLIGQAPAGCATAVMPYLQAALAENCASVTVAGGSFPVYLTGLKQGAHDIDRIEWLTWELLQSTGEVDDIQFADYAVTNPAAIEEIDPTQVNPSISIRYASDRFWRVYKGGGFKGGAAGTLRNLCRLLVMDTIYSGQHFSYGDGQYHAKAQSSTALPKSLKNGIPWTWRRDATNHHIVLTAAAL